MNTPHNSWPIWIRGYCTGALTALAVYLVIITSGNFHRKALSHQASLPKIAHSAPAPHPIRPAYLVIPTPKSLIASGKPMIVNNRTYLVIADDATDQDKEGVAAVQRELAARFGLQPLTIMKESGAHRILGNMILFGEPNRVKLLRRLLESAHVKPPAKVEGYCVRVTPYWTVVAGYDPAGTFYGAQTLCQLLERSGKSLQVAGMQVDDYPSLGWRGAHLFVGNKALPFHKRLITNIFSRYKLNNLVLQCEQARWRTMGKAVPDWAMSKADLRDDIRYARAHSLTVTPLVESVGHMGWLLQHKPPDWSEDPKAQYAIKVDNAAAHHFLFELYDEIIDTFHSQNLHIGGDEVTFRGKYPSESKVKYPKVSDAYIAEVTKLRNHLRARHVGTMLWADMLLGPGEALDANNAPSLLEAERIRALLPKDIALFDWHYAAVDAYSSPDLLRGAGYGNVIGCTWNDPHATQVFSRSLAIQRQRGLLQTTWCGYNSNESNLVHNRDQFVAFVLAAEEAWNGGGIKPEDLAYDPGKIFDAAYNLPLPAEKKAPAHAK